jgi:hypothetical protein
MAYEAIADDNPNVAQERADASALQSGALTGEVQRVTYGQNIVEVPTINHKAMGRPVDEKYSREVMNTATSLLTIGVETACVINFLPIPLRSDSCLDPLRRAYIPAPKDSDSHTVYVFDNAFLEPARKGVDAPLTPHVWHPIMLAMEFPRCNPMGVFAFKGVPQDIEDEAWKSKKSREPHHEGQTYGEALERARQRAITWMQEQLRRGEDNTRANKAWTEPQKASARRLHHLGFIKELPKGLEKERDLALKIENCPQCQKPCEPNAASCSNPGCGGTFGPYIINPRRAYEIGAIAEDHPALERLTRAEVADMGISKYVAETIDEKPNRMKLGMRKPLSEAAMEILRSDEEFKAVQRQQDAEALAEAVNTKNTKHKE